MGIGFSDILFCLQMKLKPAAWPWLIINYSLQMKFKSVFFVSVYSFPFPSLSSFNMLVQQIHFHFLAQCKSGLLLSGGTSPFARYLKILKKMSRYVFFFFKVYIFLNRRFDKKLNVPGCAFIVRFIRQSGTGLELLSHQYFVITFMLSKDLT